MKKVFLYFSLLMGVTLLGYWEFNKLIIKAHHNMNYAVIYVTEDIPLKQANKLKAALEKEGKNVSISAAYPQHISGKFNIYMAANIQNLPEVSAPNAINFLWIDTLKADENPEKLRPFDVIIVKNMPAYEHLKAINVRTAFIPDAIDITDTETIISADKAMFWGEGKEFSTALLLAGSENMALDVYGADFEEKWPLDEIKGIEPTANDFRSHPLALIDQNDKEIIAQTLNPRLIKIIESGGLPYVRYNPAIEKLFGDAIPFYYNGNEFREKLEKILRNPTEILERREAVKHISQRWNSRSQAKKIIELFEIMDKKRR